MAHPDQQYSDEQMNACYVAIWENVPDAATARRIERKFKEAILAREQCLLDRIDKEVVGEDESVDPRHYYAGEIEERAAFPDRRNRLRKEQRTRLASIRKEIK